MIKAAALCEKHLSIYIKKVDPLFNLPTSGVSDIIGYIGQIMTDCMPLILIMGGIGIGVFIVEIIAGRGKPPSAAA